MVYASRLISAVGKPLPGGTPSNGGTGVVERRVDPSTYVINLGREKLTVKVTEGALSVGQQVTVAVRNDQFIIKGITSSPPPPEAEVDADSYSQQGSSGRSPRETTQNVKTAIDTIITTLTQKSLGPGEARQCEQLFKTMEGRLSSVNRALTDRASTALRVLADLPESAPVPPDAVKNAVSAMEQLKEKILAAAANPLAGRSVALQAPVPEGIYRFERAADALEFLKVAPESRDAFARELDAAIQRDGSAVVRTAVYDNQDLRVATLVTKEELSRELESLPGRFASRAFQSIPPAVFEQLFENRCGINFAELRELDGFAAELKLPASSTRAGSRTAQDAALLQWLTSAYDARSPSASLSALLPVFSASSIIDSLEDLALSVSQLSGAPLKLPAAESFSITQGAVADAEDRSRLLETIVRRLGFTLENSLATTGTPPEEISLKQQLLETSRDLHTLAPSPAAAKGGAALVKTAEELVAGIRSQLAPLIAAAESSGSEAGGALVRDLETVLQRGADNFTKLFSLLAREADALGRTLPEKITAASRSAINGFTAEAAQRVEEQSKDCALDLEAVLRKSAACVSGGALPEKPALAPGLTQAAEGNAFGKNIELRLKTFSRDVEVVLQKNTVQIAKLVDQLKNEAVELARRTFPLPEKQPAAVLSETAVTAGKRTEAPPQIRELSRSDEAAAQKSTASLVKLLDELGGRARELAGTVEGSKNAPVPEKTAAALQAAVAAFADDAAKQLESMQKAAARTPAPEAALQKSAALIMKIIERAAREADTPEPVPAKPPAASREAIVSFANVAGKRIQALLSDISDESEAALRKSAARTLAFLNLPVDGKQGGTQGAKLAAPSLALVQTFTKETGKQVEAIVQNLRRESEAAVQNAAADFSAKQPDLPDDAPGKAVPRDAAPSVVSAKLAMASRAAIDAFIDGAAKRIETLVRDLSNTGKTGSNDPDETARHLKALADEVVELQRSARTLPAKITASTLAALDMQRIDGGKQIEAMEKEVSHSGRAALEKGAAQFSAIMERLVEESDGPARSREPAGASGLPEKISSAVKAAIDPFSVDTGKRVEMLLREILQSSEDAVRKNAAQLTMLIEQLAVKVTGLVETQTREPAADRAFPPQPEKILEMIKAVIDTFTGDAGKRVENLLYELSQSSEGAARNNSIELTNLLNRLSVKATELVQPRIEASSLPEKVSSMVQSAIDTFAGDKGKRLESLLGEISRYSDGRVRNIALELVKLLNQVSNKTTGLAADSRATSPEPVPALHEKLQVMVQSAIDAFAADTGKQIETLVRESQGTLFKNAAELELVLSRLADLLNRSTAEKPAAALRSAANAFITSAAQQMEIFAGQSLQETGYALQKNLGDLSTLINQLAGETILSSKTVSGKPLPAPGLIAGIFPADTEKPVETRAQEFLRDAAAALKKDPGSLFSPRPLQAGVENRSVPAGGSAPQSPAEKLSAALRGAVNTFAGSPEQQVASLQRELSQNSGAALQKGVNDLSLLLRQFTREAESLMPSREQRAPAAPPPGTTADSAVVPQKSSAQTGTSQDLRLAEEINELARTARSLPEKLTASLRSALAAFTNDAGKQIKTRINGLLEQGQRETVSSSRQTAETVAAKFPAETRSPAMPSLQGALQAALEKDLPGLFQKIGDLKPLVNRTTEALFRDLLYAGHDRGAQAQGKGDEAPQPARDDQSLIRQSVRQTIDTLLNRFESLQLLARQVQNPAGEQQQILAVPIKVGLEWTEMHVRFVNKKRKNTAGGSEGHYTVHLNIAPALLGAIGATMDYTRKKTLSIAMQFEHHATRQWFTANKNALAETLGALGLPSPRITLFMERKAASVPAAPGTLTTGAGTSNAHFDVKA